MRFWPQNRIPPVHISISPVTKSLSGEHRNKNRSGGFPLPSRHGPSGLVDGNDLIQHFLPDPCLDFPALHFDL